MSKTCKWKEKYGNMRIGSYFKTGCGHKQERFSWRDISDHRMKFCYYCGGCIKLKLLEDEGTIDSGSDDGGENITCTRWGGAGPDFSIGRLIAA